MFKVLITVICTLLANNYLNLGNAWIEEGYGLNPIISFPVATLLIIIPFALHYLQRKDS